MHYRVSKNFVVMLVQIILTLLGQKMGGMSGGHDELIKAQLSQYYFKSINLLSILRVARERSFHIQ